jgi:hypothetical protein
MYHNEHLEDISSANLVPCSICSSPFDPATLPSHVYDPYRTFFAVPGHSSLCSSCFAEELARRTRPPSSTDSAAPQTQIGYALGGPQGDSPDGGREELEHGTATTVGYHRPSGSESVELVRPKTSHADKGFNSYTNPNTPTIPQERSDSAFAGPGPTISRRSSSRSAHRQVTSHHRKTSSVTTISRNPSVSATESATIAATSIPGSRSVSGSTFASGRSQGTSLHKKSSSAASLSTPLPSMSPLEKAKEFRSQEALRGQSHYSSATLRRSSSLGGRSSRQRARTPQAEPTQAIAIPLPRPKTSQSHTENSQMRQSSSDASFSGFMSKPGTSSGTDMKRKVSFRQGTPVAVAFNPSSPPRREIGVASPLVEGSESGTGSGSGSALGHVDNAFNIPGLMDMSSGVGQSTVIPPTASPEANSPQDIIEDPEQGEPVTEVKKGLWSRWRAKRRREREEREARREVRRERQLERRQMEDADKGIGLELFCSQCRVVVRTVPRWREGSCCFLSAACLLLCTGPLSLCLLLPCAAHQVMDVDGQCPNCEASLSHWNRRKNMLTVHTWAGMAGDIAPPLTGDGLATPTTVVVPAGPGMNGSNGIGIPLVPLAAIQGQLAGPLTQSASSLGIGPSRPRTIGRPGSSRPQTRATGSSHSLAGGMLGGVLVLAQDIPTTSHSHHDFDAPPMPTLPPNYQMGQRVGAQAPTPSRHLRTPSNSTTYIGGQTSSEPVTSSPSTGRSYAPHPYSHSNSGAVPGPSQPPIPQPPRSSHSASGSASGSGSHRRQASLTYSASVSGNAASSSSGSQRHHHAHHGSSSSGPHSAPGSIPPSSVHGTPRSVVTTSSRAGPSIPGRAFNFGNGGGGGEPGPSGHVRNFSTHTRQGTVGSSIVGPSGLRNSAEESNSGGSGASARVSLGSNDSGGMRGSSILRRSGSLRDRDSGGSGSLAPVGEGDGDGDEVVELDRHDSQEMEEEGGVKVEGPVSGGVELGEPGPSLDPKHDGGSGGGDGGADVGGMI